MHELIEQLQDLNETVPVPLELATFEQLVEVEEQILISLPRELKVFLMEASDIIYGNIEPVTASDPHSHTYLPEVTCYAWSIGLPRALIAICQKGDSFYCIDQDGQVHFWKNGRFVGEVYESFWHWVDSVWLKN
jgi:hypothetical protein